jgi:hypothetical protein
VPTSSESSLPEDKNDAVYSKEGELVSPLSEAEVSSEGTLPVGVDPTVTEEAQLPPEAQGDTHGGPLGCCLGTTIGLLLSVSIALLSRFYADPLVHLLGGALSIVTRILMIFVAIVAVLVCGYFGWRIGKDVYREYDSPHIK